MHANFCFLILLGTSAATCNCFLGRARLGLNWLWGLGAIGLIHRKERFAQLEVELQTSLPRLIPKRVAGKLVSPGHAVVPQSISLGTRQNIPDFNVVPLRVKAAEGLGARWFYLHGFPPGLVCSGNGFLSGNAVNLVVCATISGWL